MNILSLFDGISCGLVALKQLNFAIDNYYAFEIDEAAQKVSKQNHPEIQHLGDVTKADFKTFTDIDLLLGGSPCQDLSISKSKDREGLKGEKSSLFWYYKEALDTVKPKYFLFENVASMKEKDKAIITEALGVEPILLNADSFLPQNRPRLYWTNIKVEDLQSSSSAFSQVMEDKVDEKFYYKKPFVLDEDRTKNVIGTIELNTYQANKRVFNPNGVIGCLTCVSGGYQEKKVYDEKSDRVRKLTPIEYERLQGLPDNYTKGLSNTKRYTVCGNGWCIPVIKYILGGIKHEL